MGTLSFPDPDAKAGFYVETRCFRPAAAHGEAVRSPLVNLSLVVRREHPELKAHIDHLLRIGKLVPVLPGVLRWSQVPASFQLHIEAVAAWNPDAVFLGATAAALSWWPELRPKQVEIASRPPRSRPAWLTCSRTQVPPELVLTHGPLRLACPELSVLGMADDAAICDALRCKVTTLARLHGALELMPGVRGNQARRRLLEASRGEPWSPLELEAHRRLRNARISGWTTNCRVRLGDAVYFLDIAFREQRLALELDGWQHHRSHASFIADRSRANQLILAGWMVLRFTAQSLDALVPETRRALRERQG